MSASEIIVGWLVGGSMGAANYRLLSWAFAQWPGFFEKWLNLPRRALAYVTTAGLVAGLYALAVWVRAIQAPEDAVAWVMAWANFCVPAFLSNQLLHSAVKDATERVELLRG